MFSDTLAQLTSENSSAMGLVSKLQLLGDAFLNPFVNHPAHYNGYDQRSVLGILDVVAENLKNIDSHDEIYQKLAELVISAYQTIKDEAWVEPSIKRNFQSEIDSLRQKYPSGGEPESVKLFKLGQ